MSGAGKVYQMKMLILHKDGDRFGISTRCSSLDQFLELQAALISEIVKNQTFGPDLEFQLNGWFKYLPKVVAMYESNGNVQNIGIAVGYFWTADPKPLAYIDDDGNVFINGEKVA